MKQEIRFGLVDGKDVFGIIEETEDKYLMSGKMCNFWINKDRVKVLDDEFAIILNLQGFKDAYAYARKEGC